MKHIYLWILLLVIINPGCNFNAKQNVIPGIDTNWSTLTITSEDHTVITIDNGSDTTPVKIYDSGSIFSGKHKTKIDSVKAYFTKAEKDSLFYLVEDIISKHPKPKDDCTDFVGDLKLVIYYGGYEEPGSYTRSVAYSGICNWDTLSNETRHLHAILKRRIKL